MANLLYKSNLISTTGVKLFELTGGRSLSLM